MGIPDSYCLPSVPKGLEGLTELARDLRWSWNHGADRLWQQIGPELWEKTGNPWLILQTVGTTHLKALARDPDFRKRLDELLVSARESLSRETWFRYEHPGSPLKIAFFVWSMV